MTVGQVAPETGQVENRSGPVAPGKTRRMTISAALKWAWTDELPKEPSGGTPPPGTQSAWDAVTRFGEHMSMVDRQPNRYGCIPFDRADFPHPDAIRIANAVSAMADLDINVPDGWNPLPEVIDADRALADIAVRDALDKVTAADDDGRLFFRIHLDALIIRHVIIGDEPDWQLDVAPVRKLVGNGRGGPKWFIKSTVPQVIGTNPDGSDRIEHVPIERDGWSVRSQRPLPGAYQKHFLDPDPVPVIVERAKYEVWCSALSYLCDQLAGKLDTIRLERDRRPLRPWAGDSGNGDRPPRILPDLRQVANE